ncbi:MAG: YhjD/YihY/BrkB family envelope integrity protein, partial [Gemmatimonadota bacterium]
MLRDFLARLERSDLFFLAGAITFNVIVAVIPLLLLVAGIGGYVASSLYDRPGSSIVRVVVDFLPQVGGDLELINRVEGVVEGLVEERTSFSLIGALVLAWISTRLVGTLRVVLRNIFEIEDDRGIVQGKIFDFKVVLVAGVLLLVNVAITVGIRAAQAWAGEVGPDRGSIDWLVSIPGYLLSFISAWVLFYLLYRYIPARRVDWRACVAGATFTTVFYELMKEGFAWYVRSVATFTTTYGSLAVAAVLFFWIYYGSVVFVLGAIVARSYERWRESATMTSESVKIGGGLGVAVLLSAWLGLAAPLGAQAFSPFGGNGNGEIGGLLNAGEGVMLADRSLEREMVVPRPLVEHDGAYVVVHIAESRVFVMEGRSVTWSAPAGTGHGFQLEGQGQEWTFTTPVGMFSVLRKEKDPVWLAPDWWYVQNGRQIPTSTADRLRIPGTLGTSALYLGDGIAIHGTDNPQLLMDPDPETRRVSHGCIRLTDEAARQLY